VKKIDLSREERRRYQEITGQEVEKAIRTVINTPTYQKQSDTVKANILKRKIASARANAADKFRATIPHADLVARLRAKRVASAGAR
jgi:hypothetical protein